MTISSLRHVFLVVAGLIVMPNVTHFNLPKAPQTTQTFSENAAIVASMKIVDI